MITNNDNIYIQALIDMLRYTKVTSDSLERIVEKTSVLHIKSNQVLLSAGKICSNAYFVVNGGFVCRYIHPETGAAKTINFYLNDLHPFMACIDSYFIQKATSCELRAITASTVICMPKREIDQLIAEDASLKDFYYNVIITALTEENDLKLKIISYSSEALYHYIIQNFPSVIQRVPSKYIAELMGISPEWLSKLKRSNK
jgi:CRP-like cAMP-binding protein